MLNHDSVKPVHYHISLFDLELQDAFKYQGIVSIGLKVLRPTKCIVINALQLSLHDVDLSVASGTSKQRS